MRPFIRFWALFLGLLLVLTACQGGQPTATPTAIPLEATVTSLTLAPAATEPPPQTPSGPGQTASPRAAASVAPTSIATESFAELNDQLAKATVRGFLHRLSTGDVSGAANLLLTNKARTGEAGQLLSGFTNDDKHLVQATLLQFLWTSDTTYEAEAELQWADTNSATRTSQQSLRMILTLEQGLWLIDEISLGTLQAASAVPTLAPRVAPRPTAELEGRLVLQVSTGGDLYVINADGSGLRHLTDGLDPAWSPDGTTIAFTRWRTPWGVYLINPDGTGERRIVDGVRLKEVAWSPEGSRIAFTINYGTSEETEFCFFGFCFTIPPVYTGQLWTTDLETGAWLSLPVDERGVHAPAWSPDGNRIVYAGDQGLAWIDLDTMDKGRFSGGSVWDGSPTFSPDGQRIAYMGRVHDHWVIWSMNADGSGRRQLTGRSLEPQQTPSNVSPTWSPDGKQIAFLSNRDGPWRIYVMQADGSRQRPMFGEKLDRLQLRYEWASERVLSWTR